MAEFTVNPGRLDPYKGSRFRVMWDGRYVAGVSSVTALRRTTDVILYREGGSPGQAHRSPGLTTSDPITLTRGRTHDLEFERWANQVSSHGAGAGAEVALASFRKDIAIELLNEAGQLVMRFRVYRCWPSEYVALSDLDANSGDVAFESITLEHEGWERDPEVVEPQEPSSVHVD